MFRETEKEVILHIQTKNYPAGGGGEGNGMWAVVNSGITFTTTLTETLSSPQIPQHLDNITVIIHLECPSI